MSRRPTMVDGQPVSRTVYASFDGGVRGDAWSVRPDRYRDLERLDHAQPRITRGGGYSFAAASFGAGALVVDLRRFDRILDFDDDAQTVRCEAGATLGKIFRFAQARGLHLAVQPGHPDLTVGGCIAADVHGKKPSQEGTFRRQVCALTLHHPRHGFVDVDAETSPELLDLTCGGYGLTGTIVTATLRLRPCPADCEVSAIEVPTLAATAETLAEWEPRAALLYSWNDLARRGRGFGQGVVHVGRYLDDRRAPAGARSEPYRRLPDRAGSPLGFWHPSTTRIFNRAFGRYQACRARPRRVSLFNLLFPIGRQVSYFRLFGPRGFHEAQVLVPAAEFPRFSRDLEAGLRRYGVAPTLGSCKWFAGGQELLRFDGRGVGVSVEFPRLGRSEAFAAYLDETVLALGGIANIIKDSRLPASVVRSAYPQYDRFRALLRRHDPDRLYRSELSERLQL